MLTSDRIDHSYKIQNPKITKDRKVPDPSNDSSCEAFFLENRKTVIRLHSIAFFIVDIST